MAIQMNITAEGLAKFRAALETGSLVTLKTAKFYGGWTNGAVSGSVVATLDIRTNKAIETNSNVCRFVCQDKSEAEYTTYGGEVFDAAGVVVATFGNDGKAVTTKQGKAEMMLGFEIQFENNTAASSVINMGDTTFVFDNATETAAGIIELATEAEAKAGTDTKRAITPKTLDTAIKTHSDVVHKSGAETIAGNKTFTGSFVISKDSPFILVSQNDVVKGTKPTTSQYMGLAFVDSEGQGTVNRLGLVETKYMADGGICLSLSAYKPENGSTASAGIEIIYPITGSPYINVPAPAADDSSNKIATTAWVKAVADKLLPLAGGTITGAIKGNASGALMLLTGDNNFDGASLQLYKKDHPDYPGRFYLRASTKSSSSDVNGTEKTLVGFANGSLTWDGKNVMRSSNAQEIKVVDALPASPDANTLYFVVDEEA